MPREFPQDHETRAAKWMEANPHVMRALESMARAYLRRGEKFGVKRLVEQIRWDMRGIENAGMFKVNNNFTAYIARELLRRMPRLKGLIELCVVQGEREDVA